MRAGVHPQAAAGFERAAAAYERGRAGYPRRAIAAILAEAGAAPGRTLLELGAGTGKLTSALTESGARVHRARARGGNARAAGADRTGRRAARRRGRGHSTPAASVDGVIAAQAFHWFDPVAATAEIARVLAPGGLVALIWNRRDERVAWVAELSRILDARAGDVPRHTKEEWRRGFDGNPAFEPLELRTWPHGGARPRA